MDHLNKVLDYIPEDVKNFDITNHLDKRVITGLSVYGAFMLSSYVASPMIRKVGTALTFRKDLKQRYEGAEWVIVTGGTEAIGQALCFEFAKAGFNIILISKSNIEAMKVAKTLKKDYGVQAIMIKYDFGTLTTQKDADNLQKVIEEKTKDKNVGILVNNVTLSSSQPLFHKQNFASIMQMISANVFS